MARPHPIPVSLVCSECGLDWSLHPERPTRADCINLLRAELDRSQAKECRNPFDHYKVYRPIQPEPYYPPYPRPQVWWYGTSDGTAKSPIINQMTFTSSAPTTD